MLIWFARGCRCTVTTRTVTSISRVGRASTTKTTMTYTRAYEPRVSIVNEYRDWSATYATYDAVVTGRVADVAAAACPRTPRPGCAPAATPPAVQWMGQRERARVRQPPSVSPRVLRDDYDGGLAENRSAEYAFELSFAGCLLSASKMKV